MANLSVASPNFELIEAESGIATRDAIRLLWLMQENQKKKVTENITNVTNITTVETGNVGLAFTVDGDEEVPNLGIQNFVRIPFACTIEAWTILADQTGSLVVDIWKDDLPDYQPTDADSITGSTPPTVSSAMYGTSANLFGWTRNIGEGDVLVFNLDSASDITKFTLILTLARV